METLPDPRFLHLPTKLPRLGDRDSGHNPLYDADAHGLLDRG